MIALEKKLSILLVEDDEKACADIQQYTDELDDVSLVEVTNDASHALKEVSECLPEAVILDLELHQGGGNGLQFLNDLKKLSLPFIPYILVTTNNSSTITYAYAHKAGADFIMSKHQSDYSAMSVIDFLRLIKPAIFSKIEEGCPKHKTMETPEQKTKRLARQISMELDSVGLNPKHIGYKYLVDAIELVMEKPEHNLCAIIGSRYGKTEASVERAMQNAIDKAWRTADVEDLLKHYTAKISSEKGVPTITEFIYYYVNKIKNME